MLAARRIAHLKGRGFAGLAEPVALAIHLEDMYMVREAVEQRTSQSLAAEDARPFVKGQIRSDDGGAAFVTLREGLEEQFGSCRRQRHVAELVNDQNPQTL